MWVVACFLWWGPCWLAGFQVHWVSPFLSGLCLGLQWKRAAWTWQWWQPAHPLQSSRSARHSSAAGMSPVGPCVWRAAGTQMWIRDTVVLGEWCAAWMIVSVKVEVKAVFAWIQLCLFPKAPTPSFWDVNCYSFFSAEPLAVCIIKSLKNHHKFWHRTRVFYRIKTI